MLYSSIDNKKIKELKKLSQKKYRDELGIFLIEGEHLVEEAFKTGYLKELLLEENSSTDLEIETNFLTRNIIKHITDLDTPSSIVGICSKLKDKEIGNKLLLLDGIQDPGNLGTIIRSAVAFNIDTIILGENTVDLYNSKVIRSSQGMIFNINIIEKNLKEFIPDIKNNGYKVYGTKVTDGKNLKTVEKNEKFAIIMGNEGNGLTDEVIDLCDEYIYINSNPLCESLNVGVATSIILYELDK